jgi:hypothetical protein
MLLAALAATPASARADGAKPPSDARVLTIDADAHLEQALELAMTSWHVEVVPSNEPAPGRDLDDAIRTAHRVARAAPARAVVWMARDPGRETWSLGIYDDRAHQIAFRPLPSPPPFDEATAAAIALTVKTLLYGTFEAPPPRRPTEDETTPQAPPPSAVSRHHTVRIHTLGGVRVPTNASDPVAARFGAEIAWFPPWFDHELGLAIGTDAGPSVLVQRGEAFAGTFTDTVATLGLRWRVPLRPWLSLEIGAGPGLHFSALEGSSATLHLSGRVGRVDASLETMLAAEISWKVLRVAPFVGASFLAHYQHYHVENVQVLDVPPAQTIYGIRIGVEVP